MALPRGLICFGALMLVLATIVWLIGSEPWIIIHMDPQGACEAQMAVFGSGVERFRSDRGRRPGELSDLLVASDLDPYPYLDSTSIPLDPWGHAYEYERKGTANIFIFAEPLLGWRWTQVREHRTRTDWARAVKELLYVHCPGVRVVRLVMDNLNTHTIGSPYETFEPQEARRLAQRLESHYTPEHGSWLDIAEIELRVLSGQCLDRRTASRAEIEREVQAWTEERNASIIGVDWQFTIRDARTKLKRLYPEFQT